MSESELHASIVQTLQEFNWGNYGLDILEIYIQEDLETQEWIPALASNIERDWCNYVDGITKD